MSYLVGLDFETYSAVDLPKHGLARYIGSPTFRPLIACVALNGSPTAAVEFIEDPEAAAHQLAALIGNNTIVAHNAGFEKAVLDRIGLHYSYDRFIDSAVVARAAGAAGRLEAAAPQLLNTDKLEAGKNLMRLFSIPPKDAEPDREFDPQIIEDNPDDWLEYIHYCKVDAELGLRIASEYLHVLAPMELKYQAVTMAMNETGWRVDLDTVTEMQRRYEENLARELQHFRDSHGAEELNLNSLKQLKEWCSDRGIKATSFDEKHVTRLLTRLNDRLNSSTTLTAEQRAGYEAVRDLMVTKKLLGGSSLKKLQVILDTSHKGRLQDQYLHCGAGQTLRTTGRSVQMQNLKRLARIADVSELDNPHIHWSNQELAENLRQVFTATNKNGHLIVGDFSSVESRGLAWLAGEDWKLQSYRNGADLYKMLAVRIFGVPYDQVSKEQRQIGKVGELSCGYGAGPDAVREFAENMGVKLEPAEAAKLVADWRNANPLIVDFWDELNEMLHDVVEGKGNRKLQLMDDLNLWISEAPTPASLMQIHPDSKSIRVTVAHQGGKVVLNRFFHGCYMAGRNVHYYKPSELKSGDLWKDTYINPKTKHRQHYKLYGGKLAGILTQSFCRELFFESLLNVYRWAERTDGVVPVGQFHDEIVLDFAPGKLSLVKAKAKLEHLMTRTVIAPSFPLGAEIKHDYRYTK